MLISYALGQTSIILRIKLTNTAKSDNSGATGLTNTTTGLSISTIADTEAAPTVYSASGSTIQTITTLGTFVAPTSGSCRFKQVDSINHSGIYEIQIDNSRFAVSGAKSLIITVASIPTSNSAQSDSVIPLVKFDPYMTPPTNFSAMVIDSSGHLILQPTGLDSIVKDTYTVPQLLAVIAAMCGGECSGLPSSPATFKSLDGANTRAVIAFDGNSNRISSTITPP